MIAGITIATIILLLSASVRCIVPEPCDTSILSGCVGVHSHRKTICTKCLKPGNRFNPSRAEVFNYPNASRTYVHSAQAQHTTKSSLPSTSVSTCKPMAPATCIAFDIQRQSYFTRDLRPRKLSGTTESPDTTIRRTICE